MRALGILRGEMKTNSAIYGILCPILILGCVPAPVDPSQTEFTIGGTVSGLSTSGLILQNNGVNPLTVPAVSVSFTFSEQISDGGAYNVSVMQLPTAQTCTVDNGTGTVQGANVANIVVACEVDYLALLDTIIVEDGNTLYANRNMTKTNTSGNVFHTEYQDTFTSNVYSNSPNITYPYYAIVEYYIDWYMDNSFVNVQFIEVRYDYKESDGDWYFVSAKRFTGSGYNTDSSDVAWVTSLLGY